MKQSIAKPSKTHSQQTATVTVVVPVYGDWPSLERCIASLQKYLPNGNQVLLVNDCGPEVELMERNIQSVIAGRKDFTYVRNTENLGFVRTCNRAAIELDKTDNDLLFLNSDTEVTEGFLEEMVAVLYASDKHGAVCPRSSNATIASVPFKFMTQRDERETDYAYRVFRKVRDLLPRFTVTPVAVGFCILTRRSLIQNFGLFDETYGLGYSEENDFCLRLNKYGYSSVMANHAFVYHLESRSFTSEKKQKLVEANEITLISRYPFYKPLVERYLNQYIDPVDWFADAIGGTGKVKILVDLFHLPLSFNGTTRNALSFLAYLQKNVDIAKFEIVVTSQKDAREYHSLDSFGFRVVYPGDIDELFHIGYCPSQVFHFENLQLLNKYCLRIVVSDLDIIGIRSNRLLAQNFGLRSIFLDSFRYSDRIVSISQATKDDTLNYFNAELEPNIADKFDIIPQGYPGKTFDLEEVDYGVDAHTLPQAIIDEGNYILVMGNDYAHKAVNEAVEALKTTDQTIVVVGATKFKSHDAAYTLPSGNISDSYMELITKRCKVMVFPSLYEGFGLPIAEAAFHKKPIILSDTQVSREVASLYDKHIDAAFFSSFRELPALIDWIQDLEPRSQSNNGKVRTLDEYNHDVWSLISGLPNTQINTRDLRRRWQYFNQLHEYGAKGSEGLSLRLRIKLINELRRRSPRLHAYMRDVYRSRFKK